MISAALPQFGTALLALLAVVALAVLAARAARWRGLAQPDTARRLRLAGTLALDSRRRLHLVEADGQRVLVLAGGTDCVLKLDAQP
jgi:flagellar biogenesis protein FliO